MHGLPTIAFLRARGIAECIAADFADVGSECGDLIPLISWYPMPVKKQLTAE